VLRLVVHYRPLADPWPALRYEGGQGCPLLVSPQGPAQVALPMPGGEQQLGVTALVYAFGAMVIVQPAAVPAAVTVAI
jgi:hypothetical protein